MKPGVSFGRSCEADATKTDSCNDVNFRFELALESDGKIPWREFCPEYLFGIKINQDYAVSFSNKRS